MRTSLYCGNCGEELEGDGYKTVLHCPNAEGFETSEPDAESVFCTNDDEQAEP